jgi:8-oxo-dGTP diphosphatase
VSMGVQASVGAFVVNSQGHLLLARRVKPPEAGHWGILGGKIDAGETAAQAAARELREESGLDLVSERLLALCDHIVPADAAYWLSAIYLFRAGDLPAVNQEPHKLLDMGFYTLADLPRPLTLPTITALQVWPELGA